MTILDAQGRLFGKVSLLDVGAALVMLLVVLGIFVLPGKSGTTVLGDSNLPIEVDVLVLGLNSRNPSQIIQAGESVDFVVRNQPYGKVELKDVEILPRTVDALQADGTVKALRDPTNESKFGSNVVFTLAGAGKQTDSGIVMGNINIKVGTQVEISGKLYSCKGSVIDIRAER